jgi:hypothetical protein
MTQAKGWLDLVSVQEQVMDLRPDYTARQCVRTRITGAGPDAPGDGY